MFYWFDKNDVPFKRRILQVHPGDAYVDVVEKLQNSYPELAGFVFWSDDGHYNVVGNKNGRELMSRPEIITLEAANPTSD